MRLQGRDAENAEEAQRKPQFHGDPALVAGWREQTERTGAGRRGKDRLSSPDGDLGQCRATFRKAGLPFPNRRIVRSATLDRGIDEDYYPYHERLAVEA